MGAARRGLALHTKILLGLVGGALAGGLARGLPGAGEQLLAVTSQLTDPLGQQLVVLYLAILGGVGTAGVPSGSIPFVIVVLSTIGVNPELIAIVLGVDRLLDMCRTTLNVTGDLTIATCVARAEGHPLAGDAVVPELPSASAG